MDEKEKRVIMDGTLSDESQLNAGVSQSLGFLT